MTPRGGCDGRFGAIVDERTVYSFCSICTGQCATVLKVDVDDRIIDIKGDHDHPQSLGYRRIGSNRLPRIIVAVPYPC